MTTPSWLKPWMIAAVLVIAGAGGAVAINRLSHDQHARDRADLARWTAQVDPVVTRVRAALDALPSAPAPQRAALRGGLGSARAALTGSNAPPVVSTVAQDYVAAIDQAIAALDAAGDPGSYARAIAKARATFAEGDSAIAQIRCRIANDCAKT